MLIADPVEMPQEIGLDGNGQHPQAILVPFPGGLHDLVPAGIDVFHAQARALDKGKLGASTRPVLETGSNFRPGALIRGIRVEIGQPGVKKRAFLRCDGDVLFGERLPQRLDELAPIAWTELQGLRQQVRVHGISILPKDRIGTSSA